MDRLSWKDFDINTPSAVADELATLFEGPDIIKGRCTECSKLVVTRSHSCLLDNRSKDSEHA